METQAIEHSVSSSRLHMMKKGMFAGFPIMLGYLPIALTYGVLASRTGMSNLELTLMSVLVFAGAAQFLAVGMVATGTGIIEIIIATFVLNFRHFVMSLSFVNRLKKLL
ncbi:AzlC protein [Halobacillus dabanensis]|uniref:AzlC protein n=1 Tax=Halobacillus dabanensis TaxID=240302 RepID=A0A1I3SVW0_HALDA|nr:AzlC protein [Halobacillus dabanensis]